MSQRLVCGVDSSTQSTKVELREIETGAVVAAASSPHPATTPPRSEQDPDAWWAALVDALTQVAQHLVDVAAIAVAGQQHGMVALGADDRVLRPAKLWNDTESAREAAVLVDRLGTEAWAARAGSVPVAAFTITKLAWLAAHEPEVFSRVARVCLPHDWLTFRLSGRFVTDRGDASGSGWWSPAGGAVDLGLLELVDPERDWVAQVPEVLGPTDAAGPISPEAVAATGLPASCVVAPGTGDNMAAALGLGLRLRDVVMSLGTSGTAYAVSDRPTADPTGAVAGFADAAGQYLPLVCTLNATKVTDVFQRVLGVDRERFAAMALEAPPGADGLTLVPYLDGERTPNLPDARGLLTGITSSMTAAEVARAAHEGVACGLLAGVDALVTAGVEPSGQLYLVGGGARSVAYQRVVADLTQRTVRVPTDDEVVATGACVQAAAVLDPAHDLAAIVDRWELGRGTDTAPDTTVDATAIRARYDAATRKAL